MIKYKNLEKLVQLAFNEDLGNDFKDITTDAILGNEKIVVSIKSKEKIIFCGKEVITYIFNKIDKNLKLNFFKNDGELLQKDEEIVEIEGNGSSIFKGERIILNFVQRMSGIATKTKKFVDLLDSDKIKILDTRKTLPGYRYLDKYSVKIGGGTNHRMNLNELVMIKDNHKKIAGGIKNAVNKIISSNINKDIEVEVETIKEAEIASKLNIDIIMLDNMDNEMIKKATKIIKENNPEIKIEISGNINEERLKNLNTLDIDYISVGALTHSVRAADISLNIK